MLSPTTTYSHFGSLGRVLTDTKRQNVHNSSQTNHHRVNIKPLRCKICIALVGEYNNQSEEETELALLPMSKLGSSFYAWSSPFALRSQNWTGCCCAVSNAPTVTKTPQSKILWTVALTPKTKMDPIHIERTMYHIHASICMTRWRVALSGMQASGLWRLFITK